MATLSDMTTIATEPTEAVARINPVPPEVNERLQAAESCIRRASVLIAEAMALDVVACGGRFRQECHYVARLLGKVREATDDAQRIAGWYQSAQPRPPD